MRRARLGVGLMGFCLVCTACGGGGGTTGPLRVGDPSSTRIGVVDTGFVVTHPQYADVVANYQVFSSGAAAATDASSIEDTEDPHGSYVAQTLAGKTTGFVDTAGEASLLLAKAKPVNASSSPLQTDYVLESRDILAGTRWAIDHGARAVNYSLGPMYLLDSNLRKAYEYAVSRDVAMVIAAGNESLSLSQDALSRGAGASLFGSELLRSHTLVVGALQAGSQGLELASYTNYAGADAAVQSRFLVAEVPVRVFSRFPEDGAYTALQADGTSFTAPQVTAALASLLQRWPHLGATTSTRILLDTADTSFSSLYAQNNCGEAGVGSGSSNCGLFYFGQGRLDMQAALAPTGEPFLPTQTTLDGAQATVASTRLALAPAFGDAAKQVRLKAAFFDVHGRDYSFDLASRLQSAAVQPVARTAGLLMAARHVLHEHAQGHTRLALDSDGRLQAASGEIALGGLSTLHWQRAAGLHRQDTPTPFPWLSLAGQSRFNGYDWVDEVGISRPLQGRAQLAAGWTHARLAAGAGSAGSAASAQPQRAAAANQQQLRLLWGARTAMQWTAGWTHTQEREAALGAVGAGALRMAGSSGQSAFVQLERALADGWTLFGQGEAGRMDFQGQGLLRAIKGARTSRWAAGVAHLAQGQRWGLALSQPWRIESAQAEFDVPVGRTLGNEVLRQTQVVQLAPSGRQLHVELALERPWSPAGLKAQGQWGLHLIHTHDAGHSKGQKDGALLGSLRLRW